MTESIVLLSLTAATLGLVHTLTGPDHYLPFVLMSKAGRWSKNKTLLVTLVCGTGHILSSVVIGAVGIGLGVAVSRLEAIESLRGELAAWLLIGFGLAYAAWGVHRALRNQPHSHLHHHLDGTVHDHHHDHHGDHSHAHTEPSARTMTPWVLFTIFVLGPCEPLIPLLMAPAAAQSLLGVVAVTTVFSVVTLATMTGAVAVCLSGVERIPLVSLERWSHALAGGAIALCGIGIRALGL